MTKRIPAIVNVCSKIKSTEIAVMKNDKLVLREVGERLKLTPSRIKQIESEALKKLVKNLDESFNNS